MVSEAIGTEITVMTKADWRGFFEAVVVPGCELEMYHEADFCYEPRSSQDVSDYCDTLMAKEHLQAIDGDVRAATRRRLEYFMSLFNENLSFAGFSIQLFQKRAAQDEVELFLTRPLPDQMEVAGA